MKTVLFICQANIGRSQMAEGFFNTFSKNGKAISAGVIDRKEKYHNHPAPQVIETMMEEGIDISRQTVKTVTKEMIRQSDHIIVLCEKQECPVFVTRSKKVRYVFVEDPVAMSGETLASVRDEIKRIVLKIVKEFSQVHKRGKM